MAAFAARFMTDRLLTLHVAPHYEAFDVHGKQFFAPPCLVMAAKAAGPPRPSTPFLQHLEPRQLDFLTPSSSLTP
jgi:hypothetical protein